MFEPFFERAETLLAATECNLDHHPLILAYCTKLRTGIHQKSLELMQQSLASIACELEGKDSAALFVEQLDTLNNDIDDYWYEHRHNLQEGLVFSLRDKSLVKLDRRVPGDGTKWYVADWCNGWMYHDSTVEPGELHGAPLTQDPLIASSPRTS